MRFKIERRKDKFGLRTQIT